MFRDLWFWLFLATLIIAWWLCVIAWHFRWLAKRRPPLLPTVTPETMTTVHLRLALRRLIIDPTEQDNWDEARKLLVGTDFEIT